MDISERITRSLNTVHTMFRHRGYTGLSQPLKTKLQKLNVLQMNAEYNNPWTNETEVIYCLWIPFNHVKLNSTIGKNEVLQFCKNLKTTDHVIFIADAVSFQAIDYMNNGDFYWEILSYDDTCCDKLAHSLVPTYRILKPEEIKILERKNGPRHTFPKMIARIDPIARFMDFRIGYVLEIKKRSDSAGMIYNYRIVTPADDLT
jgi:DNA-directed RNA polymerase subunit H (RpoH/RPB5)